MKGSRISPGVAIVLMVIAIALVLWQFVFRSGSASSGFSTKDLPAGMKADPNAPPPAVGGTPFTRPTRPGAR
jgi:hypothetical protein